MPISDTNRTDDNDNSVVTVGEAESTDTAEVGVKTTGEKALHVISEISSIDNFPVTPAQNVVHRALHLQEANGNQDMDVNGSVTDIKFSRGPTRVNDVWYVTQVSLLIIDSGNSDPTNFGALPGLTNGLVLRTTVNSVTYEISFVATNQELVNEFTSDKAWVPNGGFLQNADGWTGVIKFERPLILRESTNDEIFALVRDNLGALATLRMAIKFYRVI